MGRALLTARNTSIPRDEVVDVRTNSFGNAVITVRTKLGSAAEQGLEMEIENWICCERSRVPGYLLT